MRVKYQIGGNETLVDVSHASQAINCRASISNKEASGWASSLEGENVSQPPRENSEQKEERCVNGEKLYVE